LFGLNLYPLRFLEVAGCARVLVRKELRWSTLNKLDWVTLILYNYSALVWIIRAPDGGAQQFASAIDPTLAFLSLRGLIGTVEDFRWVLRGFVFVLVPYTGLVIIERQNGTSPFVMVGGEVELLFRDGVARSQGSFRHAILLGSVAASLLSIYVGEWLAEPKRLTALLGCLLCVSLVILTNSGGPVTSTGAVVLGWSLWWVRARMALVRRTVVIMFVALILLMKAPIFYLPYKISGIVGGGGYHRAVLMEKAWDHLSQWWFAGMAITDTADWLPYFAEFVGGADVTNQYLAFGLRAGLPAVLLFIALLGIAFRQIGATCKQIRRTSPQSSHEFIFWGLGVALFSHAVSWWGVAYFDQSSLVWLMHIAAAAALVGKAVPVKIPQNLAAPRLANSAWSANATATLRRRSWSNSSVISTTGRVSPSHPTMRRFPST
jgi:O-antigen ligase